MLYRMLIALWLVLLATAAHAQGLVVIGPDENVPIELNAGAGRLLQMTDPVASIFIADDDTANIRVGSPGFLTLTGLSVGETTLFALDDQDNVLTAVPVYVHHNLEAIRRVIDAVAPGHQVQAESVDRIVLLTGTVLNQVEEARVVAAVTQILRSSLGGMAGTSSDASAATSTGEVPLVSFITFGAAQQSDPAPPTPTVPPTLSCLGDATSAAGIRAALSDIVPRATTVSVRALDDSIIVSGTVTSIDTRDRIIGIVNAMAGPRCTVVDGLWFSPLQISLRVRVVEMARNLSDRIGVSWGALALRVGPNGTNTMTPSVNAIGPAMMAGVNVDVMLEALTEQGLAATLAEPTLTARSGESASFLAGGEFPYQISDASGNVTTEFRDYGIVLEFSPTLRDNGQIALDLRVEVSDLGVGVQDGNPTLTTRRIESAVDLAPGQSLAIAGLMSETSAQTAADVPGLSRIPILGALFRSNAFRRGRTELVVVVTPEIAHHNAHVSEPTAGYRIPTRIERVLEGRFQGRPEGAVASQQFGGWSFRLE